MLNKIIWFCAAKIWLFIQKMITIRYKSELYEKCWSAQHTENSTIKAPYFKDDNTDTFYAPKYLYKVYA